MDGDRDILLTLTTSNSIVWMLIRYFIAAKCLISYLIKINYYTY